MKSANIVLAIVLIILYSVGFLEPSKLSVIAYLIAFVIANLDGGVI